MVQQARANHKGNCKMMGVIEDSCCNLGRG